MNNPANYARLATLTVLWGASFLFIKVALGALSPTQIAFGRIVLGALVLVGLCLVRRIRVPKPTTPENRRLWGHILVAGLLSNVLPWTMFGLGEQTVDSGLTGVLNATTPLWTIMFGALFGTELISAKRLIGLLTGFGGVVLIFAPWNGSGLFSWGVLACVAAAVSYGLGFVHINRGIRAAGGSLPPIGLATMQLVAASGLAALALPVGGLHPIALDPLPLLALGALGVFGTGTAFALNYRVITDEGATTASTVTYLMPLVSVLLGWLVLDERVGPRILIGMAVVLAGVALSRQGRGRRATTTKTASQPSDTLDNTRDAPAPSEKK